MNEPIFFAGLIIALIWLGACVIIEGKNRKYVILTGAMIDIVLFIICKNYQMLLISMLGGLVCGLSGLGGHKYTTAVHEFNGVKNLVIVLMIFFVMLFMTMAIAYPNLEIEL